MSHSEEETIQVKIVQKVGAVGFLAPPPPNCKSLKSLL